MTRLTKDSWKKNDWIDQSNKQYWVALRFLTVIFLVIAVSDMVFMPVFQRIITSQSKFIGSLIHSFLGTMVMVPILYIWFFRPMMRQIKERRKMEEELREQKEFSEQLIQNCTVPIFVLDREHKVKIWNYACEELTGIKASDVLNTDKQWMAFYEHNRPCIADLVLDGKEEDLELYYEVYRKSKFVTEGLHSEGWYPNLGGSKKYIIFDAAPIRNSKGEIVAVIETLLDITKHKLVEEALRESEERYRDLLENANDLILCISPEGEFRFMNKALQETMGYSQDEVERISFYEVIHPESLSNAKEIFNRVLNGEVVNNVELSCITKKGQIVEIEGNLNCRFEDGRPYSIRGIFRDVTDRKRQEQTIKHLAYHDCLTGLPNRRLFRDRLTVALACAKRSNRKLAILFLDLDGFKYINDTLGHSVGDQLLQKVAKRLTQGFRKSDTIARMGGDEFMILLPEINNVDDVVAVANKIIEGFKQPFTLQGHDASITASVGIALYPDDGKDEDTLLKNADMAMYKVKESSRNGFKFFSELKS